MTTANSNPASSRTMSQRSHFWLRLVGLAIILVAEFGPRLWNTPTQATQTVTSAAVADAVEAR